METYDDVLLTLRETYEWPLDVSPAPDPVQVELDKEATPSDIAMTLDNYVVNSAAQFAPPYGYPGTSYEYQRYRLFCTGKEYWDLNTKLALGQTVEIPVPMLGYNSRSVTEWHDNQAHNVNRKGDGKLLDDEAALAARRAHAANVPLEWAQANKNDIWELAVVEGYIPTGVDGFEAAYAQTSPSLDSVLFLSAQQWLTNLTCDDKGKPSKWMDSGELNPAWKP
jgi:hypothetical protein